MPTISFNQYFPGYEILGELGRANARVLKARHLLTGDLVAIKHFSFNTDAETLRRFQQESTIMTTIQHPNVVKVREVHFDAELPYIVMELVEGGDVRSLLKKSDFLDVPTVIRLGLQMADALKAIHDKGVVHRDIKPDNIMYRELQSGELHFLLTDFGIAKLRNVESMTITGQAPMTPEYASPEQFNDLENAAEATDFYSLGVVLYECLTGSVPFPLGSKGIGALSRKVEEEVPPPVGIPGFFPASLQKIVNNLLQKKPNERLTNTTALKRSLKKADLEWDEGENEAEEISPLLDSKTKVAPIIDPVKPIVRPQLIIEKPVDKIPAKQVEGRIEEVRKKIEPKKEVEPQKKSGSSGLGWAIAIGFVIVASIAAIFYFNLSQSSTQQPYDSLDTAMIAVDSPMVKYDTIETTSSSTSTREQIIAVLNNYYQINEASECDQLVDFYLPIVEKFHSKTNQTRSQIISECKAYNNRWPYQQMNIDNSTLSIKQLEDGGYFVTYDMFFQVKRTLQDNWKDFNLIINVDFTPELKIRSIYEYKKPKASTE